LYLYLLTLGPLSNPSKLLAQIEEGFIGSPQIFAWAAPGNRWWWEPRVDRCRMLINNAH